MSITDCRNYNLVKQNILDCYEQAAEVYWQEFRQVWRNSSDFYMEFSRKKLVRCGRWPRSKKSRYFRSVRGAAIDRGVLEQVSL